MYVEINDLKKHLNIDAEFIEDDTYLEQLEMVAEEAIAKHIDANLSDLADMNGGVLPSPLIHAIKLFVGDMYASREAVAFTNAVEIPLSYTYLLSLYKKY